MSTISIAIPVYNQADTIESAILSALNQQCPPHEVVVCENFSTDGTAAIVEKYRGRVKIVRPPRHLGMAENWNHAVRACSGDWVGMCSGDDILLPCYIVSFTSAIARSKRAVFAMGGWENRDEASGKITPWRLLSMREVTCPPQTVITQLYGPKASFSAFCFRRRAFDEIGGFDIKYNLVQDWILQYKLAFIGEFIRINDLVAQYRIQHRPELEIRRRPLYAMDRCRFIISTIWDAETVGIGRSVLLRAAKFHFQQLLAGLAACVVKDDKKFMALVGDAAKKSESESVYDQWLRGEWRPSRSRQLLKALRSKIRNMLTLLG